MVVGSSKYPVPKGSQIVYTLGPMYLYRDYLKAKVYTMWVPGSFGIIKAPL